MLALVNADFAAPGKGQGSKSPPPLLVHVRDLHVLRFEISQGRRKVVAHEEKLVLVVLLGIMERGLKWRHREDQPAVAGINVGKLKHIPKKGPIGFGILGIDNDMRRVDQCVKPRLLGWQHVLTAPPHSQLSPSLVSMSAIA